MIFGYPWFHEHNPEVNWKTQEVTLSRCPAQCHTCRVKLQEEQKQEMRIYAIHMRPLLQMVEEEKNEDGEGSEDSEPLLEPGDCLLVTVSTSNIPVPMITATATTSQQLAEKALQSIPAKEKELRPLYLCDFEDVFVKEFFDSLPE